MNVEDPFLKKYLKYKKKYLELKELEKNIGGSRILGNVSGIFARKSGNLTSRIKQNVNTGVTSFNENVGKHLKTAVTNVGNQVKTVANTTGSHLKGIANTTGSHLKGIANTTGSHLKSIGSEIHQGYSHGAHECYDVKLTMVKEINDLLKKFHPRDIPPDTNYNNNKLIQELAGNIHKIISETKCPQNAIN